MTNKLEQLKKLGESIDKEREEYYQSKLKKRNWFQKLFNIKPDMKFYDMCNFSYRIEMTKIILQNPDVEYFK